MQAIPLLALLLVRPTPQTSQATPPVDAAEASGVVRHGDHLLIVSDSDPGAYYSLPMAAASSGSIDPARLQRTPFPGGDLAVDLEEIDVLLDGRVVALSERLRSLIAADGRILEYDD